MRRDRRSEPESFRLEYPKVGPRFEHDGGDVREGLSSGRRILRWACLVVAVIVVAIAVFGSLDSANGAALLLLAPLVAVTVVVEISAGASDRMWGEHPDW